MKKSILLIGSIFLLLSCSPTVDNRITLDRSTSNGGLLETDGETIYKKAIDEEKNIVVLLGIDDCLSCTQAKDQCDAYGRLKVCDIYYVNLTTINETQYNHLLGATSYANKAYSLPIYGAELSLPKCYIFSHKGVVIAFSDDFVSKLDTHVKVSDL